MYQESSESTKKQRGFFITLNNQGKRPLQLIAIMAVLAAVFFAVAQTFAQNFNQNLSGGDTLTVSCSGKNLQIVPESSIGLSVVCVANDGDPNPTNTPAPDPDPTEVPNPTNTPAPDPTSEPDPPSVTADYGEFPNGKNGGVCAESHAWWQETFEEKPRHVHSGACVPAARGKGGQDGPIVNNFNISARALSFNDPGEVNWHRAQWQGNTVQVHDIKQRCQNSMGEFKECSHWVEYNLQARGGMDELRLATDTRNGDLGTRQYSVINFQVRGGSGGNYRGGPWIIGRHWYDGFGYVRVYLLDYMEYVKPNESMPTVSGIFKLNIKHDGSNCTTGQMFINPKFHQWHAEGSDGPTPDEVGGCGSHTYTIDTTKLPNGRNGLYFQTMAEDSRGELASAVQVFINVQN